MNTQSLKKYFHFTDADLFANRNGRLSENQQKKLEAEARAERKSARESAVILLVIAGIGIAFGLLISLNTPTLFARVSIGSLLCVLWPLAWGWKAWEVLKSAPDMENEVKATRGAARVIRVEDEFMLEVGERQFDLEKNPSNVISDGDELVVFYLERTEEILSVEAL